MDSLMAIVRAFLRAFLLTAFILVLYIASIIGKRPWSAKVKQKIYRCIAFIMGLKVHSSGNEGYFKASRKRLFVANHQSYLDVIALGSLCPATFLAKKEAKSYPLIGKIAERFGTEFVDRKDLHSRATVLRRVHRILQAGSLCVFPEGTTTATNRPSADLWCENCCKIALKSQAQVMVVGIVYASKHAAWTGDASLVPHMMRCLLKSQTQVAVAIHEHSPIQSSEIFSGVCAACEQAEQVFGVSHGGFYESDVDVYEFPSLSTRVTEARDAFFW